MPTRRTLLAGIGLSLAPCLTKAADDSYGLSAIIDGGGMVKIPAGEFQMGSQSGESDEQPTHRVRITHDFELGKYEVTQAQWDIVLAEAHPKPGVPLRSPEGVEVSRKPSHFGNRAAPVEKVSWDDVQLFLARLNARDSSHLYRLPTEAEWEYAARAGKTVDTGNLDDRGWYKSNSEQTTHTVGLKQPNAWGLYDMEGNVAEWVSDWYGHEYYDESPLADPAGPKTGSYKVYRGGSWLADGKACAVSHRGFDFPINRFYNVG